jgi:hypothetical protein
LDSYRLIRKQNNIFLRMATEFFHSRNEFRSGGVGKRSPVFHCSIRASSYLVANVLVGLSMFPGDIARPDDSNSHQFPRAAGLRQG